MAAAGAWLGRGLANLVAVLDPDVVVVGGAALAAGEIR
jgi:predicted NBD/HSP70 family sugar kinase